MKFLARFVVPNKSANLIGIDLTKQYPVDVVSNSSLNQDLVILSCPDFPHKFLLQIIKNEFREDKFVLIGWFNYDYTGIEPYLFKGAIELRNF